MMTHAEANVLLYDFIHGDLDETAREAVEQHLHGCRDCASDAASIRKVADLLRVAGTAPSEIRSDIYWHNFSLGVQERIARTSIRALKAGMSQTEPEKVNLLRRIRPLLAGAVALSVIALCVSFWMVYRSHSGTETHQSLQRADVPPDSASAETDDQLRQYFRQSKNLLVGVVNMKESGEDSVDMTVERDASRRLLRRGRDLSNRPLDVRSRKLIDDLNRVMLVLANGEPVADPAHVGVVRNGIHRENLLFKVRIEEARYGRPQMVLAKNTY